MHKLAPKSHLYRENTNLLIVGKSTHDRGVDDAAEHHGQRVDGQRAIAGLLLHQVTELLVGHLHGFYGVLQRTDLLLWREKRRSAERFAVDESGNTRTI